jgi:S1-C subfamily serine protease
MALGAVAFVLVLILIVAVGGPAHGTVKAEPMVKVVLENGHGSAFHIGDGYYFTAAHVVGALSEVEILDSEGQTHKAEVLWSNRARDVALLRSAHLVEAANLSCRTPNPGEVVEARGNPANLNFISTWGRVGGKPLAVGPWRNVVPVSMTIIPGMSGGPAYDADGFVVGLNVGVVVVPFGFGGSLVGVGYIVPGRTLCDLLTRD